MAFSDRQIIADIQQGGVLRERMVRYLFDQYAGWVKNGLRKHRLQEDAALDAYTDTILTGVDHIIQGRFEGSSQLSTYLFQIFSNKCVDRLRRNSTYKGRMESHWTDELPELSDSARGILRRLEVGETFAQLESLVFQLGDRCRQLIWDTEYWGYELNEIASRLGLKDARSASTQKYRCMEKLRSLIRKKMGKYA